MREPDIEITVKLWIDLDKVTAIVSPTPDMTTEDMSQMLIDVGEYIAGGEVKKQARLELIKSE